MRTGLVALTALSLALSVGAGPAAAKGEEIRGSGDEYFRADPAGSPTTVHQVFGLPDDGALVGDWDGDGVDTLAVRRGNRYHFKNTFSGAIANFSQTYGTADDEVLVGDWDGDGVDTLAVRRGNRFHLKNTFIGAIAEKVVTYGRDSDHAFAGGLDTAGGTGLGVRRPPPAPEPAPAPDPQPPVFAYGTLRSGQSAHYLVEGRTSWEQLTRMPYMDLYMIPGYTFPWAVPSAREYGAVGELMDFPSASYWDMVARLDRYELYDPSLPPDSQRYYYRTQRPTLHAPSAWVYVATQRWQDYARSSGTLITTGDFTRW